MNPTLGHLLDDLSLAGLYDSSRNGDAAGALASTGQEPASPWYIQGLVGAGAWLAAVMFLVFFFGTLFAGIREWAVFIAAGLILTGGAVILLRSKGENLFLSQFALALGLAGQVLFSFGMGSTVDELWAAAGGLFILQIVLIPACRNSVHRFWCVTIASGSVVFLIFDLKMLNLLNLLVLALAAGCLTVMGRSDFYARRNIRVMGNAMAFSLLGVLLLTTITRWNDIGFKMTGVSWWWSTAGLLLVLLVFEVSTLRTLQVPLRSGPAVMLISGTLLLAFLASGSPGTLGGLLVLGLGFQRADRFWMGISLLYLPVFLTAYYYYMDLSLLEKSGVLIVPGILMLVFRLALRRHTVNDGREGEHA